MDSEERDRLVAETEKLRAEALSIRRGGWSKPSSWVPMLAAFAAMATSIGQLQMSSINERQASLDAREKVVEAKEEESILIDRNRTLELRAQNLTEEIAAATAESLLLREEIQQADKQLLELASQGGSTGTLTDVVEREVAERAERTTSIVASAEKRNTDAQISYLVWQMNSSVKSTRLDAVASLIESYSSNEEAISSAIDLITMPQLDTLTSEGRINVLVYLRNTDPASWSSPFKERASNALDTMRKRADQGRLYIGPQTDEAIVRLESLLQDGA